MNDPTKAAWWRDFELDGYFSGSGNKPFIELAVLASMIAAAADGTAGEEEYDHIVTVIDLASKGAIDRDRIDQLMQRAISKIEQGDIDALMAEVKDRVSDKKSATAALAFAIACAFSDGNVGEEEKTVLEQLAKVLGVDRRVDDLIAGVLR
jgi:tellurite resistance protein